MLPLSPPPPLMNRHITNHEQNMRVVDQITTTVAGMGIAHLIIEDEYINGRTIKVRGNDVLNFGNCSYLGLETDPRLKAAAIEAIDKYGIMILSSRAFSSIHLYPELESLLSKMTSGHALISTTITLGHMANLPVIVGDNDAVIVDIQAHNCLQTTVELLRQRNIPIEKIRHNRMDILEDRIKELKDEYDKIWYIGDGVYSMYGDYLPANDLKELLDRYEQLNLYVDDAHGTGWIGRNGAGYVNSKLNNHPRVIYTLSLGKSFGCTGGVTIFPTEAQKSYVRHCGATHIFCGPLPNPVLGAGIASAKIHLSPEINVLQERLQEHIKLFNNLVDDYDLPLVHGNDSPIFFIGVGKPSVGFDMVHRLMNRGIYVNLSVFPSVSYNRTGLRMPITLHHTREDIEYLVKTIAEELPQALIQQHSTMKSIHQAFKLTAA
jgi:7-keto-8-aminopelargonate synthetase-like enzyme